MVGLFISLSLWFCLKTQQRRTTTVSEGKPVGKKSIGHRMSVLFHLSTFVERHVLQVGQCGLGKFSPRGSFAVGSWSISFGSVAVA